MHCWTGCFSVMAEPPIPRKAPEAEFIDGMIASLQSLPVAWAQPFTLLLLLGLLLICWSIPRAHVVRDAPPGRWRDLRIWASVLILLQLGLYQLFS